MKLLFVTHWANNMLIFRTWMLQEAVRRGHDVVVLCPPDSEADRFAGLGVRKIPWSLRRGGGLVNLFVAILNARRIIRQEKPDATVIYCVQPIMAVLWAWKLGAAHGRLFPIFTGLGSLWTDLAAPSLKKQTIRRLVEYFFGRFLPMADLVFVLNQDDKAQVSSWNFNALCGKVQQGFGEGVDLEFFKIPTWEEKLLSRQRWGIPQTARVIGFVGRLIREKGATDFLMLCEQWKTDENVHFLVVGDPDPGNPSSLSASEVHQLERIPRMHREPWMTDVRPAYAAMDLLVFLSAREGLPVSPLEAMAMGVPVVAYDAVGTKEVVPREWLIPQGDFSVLPGLGVPAENVRQLVIHQSRSQVQGGFLDTVTQSTSV